MLSNIRLIRAWSAHRPDTCVESLNDQKELRADLNGLGDGYASFEQLANQPASKETARTGHNTVFPNQNDDRSFIS